MNSQFIIGLDDDRAGDIELVGGKGAGLGALTHIGVAVPAGVVVSAETFDLAMQHAGIDARTIGSMIATHPATYTDIRRSSARLRMRTQESGFPPEIRGELREAIDELRALDDSEHASFAIRSSALDEDSHGHSFAGMNTTLTNVSDLDEIERAIVTCWMSAFGQRVLTYRALQRISTPIRMAVVVQLMIDSHRSGVMFTRDPTGRSVSSLVIESAFGQGEVVVGGEIEPDTFIVERSLDGSHAEGPPSIHVGRKQFMVTRDEDGSRRRTELGEESTREPSLSDIEVIALADLGIEIEKSFAVPQDIEWCIDPMGRIWIVQSRPITTRDLPADERAIGSDEPSQPAKRIQGLAASPGRVTGPAHIVRSLEDARSLRLGEILIADMTTPEWVGVIDRAAAVVTDRGGITSHAAIVSRELGVPAVVGTRTATITFADGDLVEVNGSEGTVALVIDRSPTSGSSSITPQPGHSSEQVPELRTRVMVNLAHPRNARAAADIPGVAGVGLLRAEFLLSQALGGVHPNKMVADGRSEEFIDILARSIEAIAAPFGDRTIVYRTADFRSNEFRHLDGGDQFEPVEENPMIGFRGCFRYVRDPELFRLELEAIDRVRGVVPNLTLMLPFVRTRWELEKCIGIIVDAIDPRAPRLPIWVMAEVPSVLYRMADYRDLGITGISIGSNDLTQLMLGVDRDSEICAELFDEQDDAVLAAIGDIIARAREAGMSTSLCGQAPSNHPEFARALVGMGIDSISVDPSAVADVQRNLRLAESSFEEQETK